MSFCSFASDRILRSYKRSLNGFAAKLSEEEAHKLSGLAINKPFFSLQLFCEIDISEFWLFCVPITVAFVIITSHYKRITAGNK